MSFFEMLEFINDIGSCETCSRRGTSDCGEVESCKEYIREWLDSEVEEDGK